MSRWLATWLLLCGVACGQVDYGPTGTNKKSHFSDISVSGGTGLTIMGWSKPDDSSFYIAGDWYFQATKRSYLLRASFSKLGYFIDSNGSSPIDISLETTDAVPTDKMTFYAGTYDISQNVARMYIDGRAVSVTTTSMVRVTNIINRGYCTSGNFFDGTSSAAGYENKNLSDTRIYNRALTASEISEIYNRPWELVDENALVLRTCVNSGDTGNALTGTCRNYGTGADGTYINSPSVAPGKIQTIKPFEEDNP